MLCNRLLVALSAALQLILGARLLQAEEGTLVNREFIEQYAATRRFSLGKPNSIRFAKDRVLFLRSGPRSPAQDLFEFDPNSGAERALLTSDQILGGAKENLTPDELARRERMRTGARGIAFYSVCDDQSKILVPLSGKLFIVDLASGNSSQLIDEGGYPIDPQFSLDGSKVACVREHELYAIDIASNKQIRLTRDANENVTNGEAEFVAQEEMARTNGFWWSPDGLKIAYEQVDTTGVERFHISDPADAGKAPQVWPYPRAGRKNSATRLGVISAGGGETTWVQWDHEKYPYFCTVRWSKNSPLVVLVQNREQTEEVLLAVDPDTGKTREFLREIDSAWLNLAQSCPKFLEDGASFLWMTERGGAWQLERRDSSDGKLLDTLTQQSLGLRGIVSVDSKAGFVYLDASDDPTESHVWRVPLNSRDGSPTAMTRTPGHHSFIFSKDHRWMIETSSTPMSGGEHDVYNIDGKKVGTLKSVAEEPNITPKYELARVGEKKFAAYIVRPRNFDSTKKYPVIAAVYGGPGAGVVANVRDAYLHSQWLADQGFIIVGADGRGLTNRGRNWERVTKNNFIDIPLADQVDAIKALGAQHPEMDLDRVGVSGWSFGGYFTAMAVMRRPDFFKCGVAGAPVVDFADYDTYYTERFLGLPDKNVDGYRACNVLTWAKDLSRPLLIIHGTADDNVYFMNSLKLCDALIRAGKRFEFMPLPGFTHSPRDPAVNLSIELRGVEFFKRNLGEPK